jgi:hypothetical protein
MISFSELKDNLYTIISSLSSQVIIWGDQNASTPEGDYIRLKITNFSKIGFEDWVGKPDETGIAPTQGDREFILSIQSISANSVEILASLIEKLGETEGLEQLSANKLAYVGEEGQINDITTKIGDRFEHRAVVDIRFRISKNYTADLGSNTGYIESVEVKSKVNTFEDNYLIES